MATKMNFGQQFVPYRSAAKNMYLKGELSFWFYIVAQPITSNVNHKVPNPTKPRQLNALWSERKKIPQVHWQQNFFFNLSYPFFLGYGHCSMSLWPLKSVGSTKGGGGTADIVTSASYSATSLLSFFMSLSETVLQSPSKELFYWKILKVF